MHSEGLYLLVDDSGQNVECIDCGEVRNIISSEVQSVLESKLQKLDVDSKDARIAYYFDFIAGTSIRGLMTSMLTAPNDEKRPLFAAKDIKNGYVESRDCFDSFAQPGGHPCQVGSVVDRMLCSQDQYSQLLKL
ncbi:hypothetical protein NC653_039586 [Populus alba x Populus x berolinensis]|uniref:Uncharacterized protein n=1 Tax=Populus alba x Populus x berolinensis TaxID=444605 RepID=A0AAD6LBR3_9ROSI|nr:hypothetical protein NC653_039586 [Populus alba x Populus x berolinensis]